MKRVLSFLITFILFVTVFCFGDTISLSFKGSGAPLNSIRIENSNRKSSIDLKAEDTLCLTLSTNTKIHLADKQSLVAYPNPSGLDTYVNFSNSDAGFVRTSIVDLNGNLIVNDARNLPNGENTFIITGLQCGLYLLKVQTATNCFSTKIISTNQVKTKPYIQYLNSISLAKTDVLNETKEFEGKQINMEYSLGDQLTMIGYSSGYKSDTIFASPTTSQLYTFYFTDISVEDGDSTLFPLPSDALFYSDYFNYNENKWKDKSGNGNDANLVQSNCGTVKTSTQLKFNQPLDGSLQDWLITHNGSAELVLSLSDIKFKKTGTIYNIRLTNIKSGKEHFYPCSEGILTAYDCSGNDNHITISGSSTKEWTANKQDDFHYNLMRGGNIAITNNLLLNPTFKGSFTNGLAPDWIDYNTIEKSEETSIVRDLKSQRFKANNGGGIRTNINLKYIKEGCFIHFTAWVYVVSGKARASLYGYLSTSASLIETQSTKTGSWEMIEIKTMVHTAPTANILASIFAAQDGSEIIVGETRLTLTAKNIIVPALENTPLDALGRLLEVAPNSISKVETSIQFSINQALLAADRNNLLFNTQQQPNQIKLQEVPFANVNMVYENTLFCNQQLNELIIFREPIGNGYNLQSLLYKWGKPTVLAYKNSSELSDNYLENIVVKDVNRNFRVGTVNWGTQLVVSSDHGNTWSKPVSYDSNLGIHQMYITSKGTVLIFYSGSKIRRLQLGSSTLEDVLPTDENGDVIQLHKPINPNFPGEYFKPYHKLLDLYDPTDNTNLIVWGNWANNDGAKGASPIGVFYSTDDCSTIKRFYYFGQNPNYTDTGGNAGKNGVLLGNPKNPIYCRHVHEVSYNKYTNKIFITCGDSHIRPELHIFETSYDKHSDTWAPFVDLISDEARCQRHRAIGIGFDEDGYLYFGSDGDPQIIVQDGIQYHSQGVYKVHKKDINDMSKYILLHKTGDIVVNSYMNENYMLFSSPEKPTMLYISVNRGRIWKEIDVSEYMTKWYPYDNTTTSNIELIKEDNQNNIFLKTPIGAYVNLKMIAD